MELVKFLIAEDANVNQIFTFGVTPLIGAIMTELGPNIQIITALLQNGADPNIRISYGNNTSTPLMLAIKKPMEKNTKLGLIKLLVQYKAKINDVMPLEGQNTTPLNEAILENDTKLVKELLEAGADPSLKNSEGQTAVDVAQKALDDVTKELTKATSQKDKEKYAQEKKNYENIIKLLKAKEQEIAKKTPVVANQKSLLISLQNLTQKLRVRVLEEAL